MSDDAAALLELAEPLYALPLADFTPARDASVKEHKGTPLATALKALRKPSNPAWVVNLLVRHETEQVEQVLAVGAALREAQDSMSADDLRSLTKQRRQLTAAVTTTARGLAREHGLKVTQAVADQVEATLTAAMLDADCAAAVRSGLLVTALRSTGVDAVDVHAAVALPEALGFAASAAAAEAPRPELRLVPDPDADAKARRAAERALAEAADELEQAQAAHDEAQAEVSELEARALQLQGEIDEVRRRLAEHESDAEEVDDALEDAEQSRDEADAALSEARRVHADAEAALRRIAAR
ncbi:hypothetical protein [Nocardioides acrostichi]|uniref:Uncharacterized protein n=1 Tax=Nocardioides acrostichi TaxID=2784339 RepID=A0A930UZS0_9ACTN|nr:hypothetical protein [Nocardioides acrostichi]MBF4160579.1 hypothetical protein [Nocardioides acrostichi]